MSDTLADRMKAYEAVSDYELMRRVPIIVRLDGRGFHKVCQNLSKPFEIRLLKVMSETMLALVTEIGGAVFGYQQSDEITIVVRNDQTLETEPWYSNRIQKIASVAAAIATLAFNRMVDRLSPKLDLSGDAVFDARVFALPSLVETVNCLIWRQQDCINNAICGASQAILTQKLGKKAAIDLLANQSVAKRLELMSEAGISFEEQYPSCYRLGVAAYKIPTILVDANGQQITRKKWILDWEAPDFLPAREFIYNILLTGHDVFREQNFNVTST